MLSRLIFLTLYWSLVNTVAATKCYNCGTKNTESCDNFNPNNSSFVVDCPKKYSCGLETHGDTKVRTCEPVYLDDCQKANNIEYCYCTGDLCNGNKIQFTTPSDDEDLIEGSGRATTIIPTSTFKPQVTVPKLTKGDSEIARVNMLLLYLLYIISSVI